MKRGGGFYLITLFTVCCVLYVSLVTSVLLSVVPIYSYLFLFLAVYQFFNSFFFFFNSCLSFSHFFLSFFHPVPHIHTTYSTWPATCDSSCTTQSTHLQGQWKILYPNIPWSILLELLLAHTFFNFLHRCRFFMQPSSQRSLKGLWTWRLLGPQDENLWLAAFREDEWHQGFWTPVGQTSDGQHSGKRLDESCVILHERPSLASVLGQL